jgi:hypothetical protein
MRRAAILNALRLVIALAVILSAVPFLGAAPASQGGAHFYAVQEADLGMGNQGGHTHSHSHGDGEDDGTALPSHGHEYTDHSHITFGLPTPTSASLTAPERRLVRVPEQCPPAARPPFRLDRPPCLLSSA